MHKENIFLKIILVFCQYKAIKKIKERDEKREEKDKRKEAARKQGM